MALLHKFLLLVNQEDAVAALVQQVVYELDLSFLKLAQGVKRAQL